MISNTELVQNMYAAFGRGDVPALLANMTDDIEWTMNGTLDLPYMGTFRGKAAVAQWFGHVAQADDIQVFEPREFFAGADHVTVLGWERTRALPGGGVFEAHWMHLMTMREGKLARFVGLYDTAAAAQARAAIRR